MSNTPHELAGEFPNDHALLHDLKMNNPHFVTLAERYHEVNSEIHRIEAGIETTSDEYTETLKKKRLALLDEIAAIIAKAKADA
ncbi:MAG: YdcH family protein [Novosphingobium sp.]